MGICCTANSSPQNLNHGQYAMGDNDQYSKCDDRKKLINELCLDSASNETKSGVSIKV